MSLSRTQSVRAAAVLEDCSNQLDILRYTVSLLSLKGKERAKLKRDCEFFSQQISTLRLELEEKQTFSSLTEAVERMKQEKTAERNRGRDEEQKRREAELEERKQTLQRQKEELQEKKEKLQESQQLKKDLNKKLRITEKTIALRLERTECECSEAEEQLEEQLELLHKWMREERRGHERTMKFLQNRREELQQQLQHWQQHTDDMLQEKQQELNVVSCKRIVNLDRLSEMRRKFIEMERVVKEDREEQEQLQAEARAATKLQAWWKGCLVRRGIGSFRKAEEAKKGKRKEGKKKKKEVKKNEGKNKK